MKRLRSDAAHFIITGLLAWVCGCTSIVERVSESIMRDLVPVIDMTKTVLYYDIINGHFPESPQELVDFTSVHTNSPRFDLADFKVLTFDLGESNSLTIYYDIQKAGTSCTGTMTMISSHATAEKK